MEATVTRSLGRYRLDRLLGRGGMAEVYRAVDGKLGRTVAIKVVLPQFTAQPAFLERFLREAQAVAALDHPNILPVYDFGEENGVPFLVMPCLEGGTLADRIGEDGLPSPTAVAWAEQLAAALDAAHAAGILHRDVKPGNVLLDRNERPILADFGLARVLGETSDLTRTGILVGTPLYMAPELALGEPASPRSDLYALAALTYQTLGGVAPFTAETPLAVLHQHVSQPVPLLSDRVCGLPPKVDAVFERALAKEPAQRPASCTAFAEELRQIVEAGIAPPAAVVAGAGDSAAAVTARRSRAPLWLILAAGGLIAAAALLRVVGGTPQEPVLTHIPTEPVSEPGQPPAAPGGTWKSATDALRRPRLLDAGAFAQIERRVAPALERQPDSVPLAAIARFAEGGRAYAAGDDKGARSAIDRIRQTMPASAAAAGAPIWMFDRDRPAADLADFEVAVIYGDARGEGVGEVERHLATNPNDPRALLSRATLRHIHGDHLRAIADAEAAYRRVSGDPAAAGVVSRFLADELSELGRYEESLDAYRRAIEHGGPAAGPAALTAGQILLEQQGNRAAAREMFRAACSAGVRQACTEYGASGGRRGGN